MTYIEQAIRKAVSGGYIDPTPSIHTHHFLGTQEVILLDPLFWQSLGKAMGWGGYTDGKRTFTIAKMGWLDEWHRFIDHLASNGDPETFFKETLTK